MSRVVEKNEEQMQYHLNSSCFSSEVMVEFKCVSSGLGENAFRDRWKFTIGVTFYVPNTSLAQNSSSPGQWKTCKYYVKNAKKTPFLIDILTEGDIVLVNNEL